MSRQPRPGPGMLGLVREEDVRRIIARLVRPAQAGDLAAAQLLPEFTIGPPPSVQDMTGEEDDKQDCD